MVVVGICAVASILSRFLPKKGTVQQTVSSTPNQVTVSDALNDVASTTNVNGTAVIDTSADDYKEYLKYKTLIQKYESLERFSIVKFFKGFLQSKNWAKSVVFTAMAVVLLFAGFSIYKEAKSILYPKDAPVVSNITSGGGNVDSKTESNTARKQNNGLTLNLFSGWF